MSIHELAVKIGSYLGREIDADPSQELRMVFGLELFLGDIIKLIFITILAYFLAIIPEVLTIMAAACILRMVSGGEHCSAYYRCLIGGVLCFLLLGWMVHSLNPLLSTQFIILTAIICFLLAEIIFWKYAPGDTENKPITDEADQTKFKMLSLLLGLLYLIIMITFVGFASLRPFVLPIAVGMMEQAFTVTPWGYSFLHYVDHILDFDKWN